MQQQVEHESFFYDYFPQFPYGERNVHCNSVQDYQIREICQDKSKVYGPVPHSVQLAPPPAHCTPIQNATHLNINKNILPSVSSHVLPPATTNFQPCLSNTLQQLGHLHQSQHFIPIVEQNSVSNVQNNNIIKKIKEVQNNNSLPKKKRIRLRHMINPDDWIRNKNKKARMLGKAYKGWIKTPDGKYILGAERKALKCGPPCNCKRSKQGKDFLCGEILEKERKAIFEKTCALSWEAKKVWVQSHVEMLLPRKNIINKRNRTMCIAYYLPTSSGRRKRVCRSMFLSTLGRNRRQIESWIKDGRLTISENSETSSTEEDCNYEPDTQTGEVYQTTVPGQPLEESKKLLRKKGNLDKRKRVRDFFDTIPKTFVLNYFHLDPSIKSGAALYKMYKETVGEQLCVSTFVFFQEMKTMKLKLVKPKRA